MIEIRLLVIKNVLLFFDNFHGFLNSFFQFFPDFFLLLFFSSFSIFYFIHSSSFCYNHFKKKTKKLVANIRTKHSNTEDGQGLRANGARAQVNRSWDAGESLQKWRWIHQSRIGGQTFSFLSVCFHFFFLSFFHLNGLKDKRMDIQNYFFFFLSFKKFQFAVVIIFPFLKKIFLIWIYNFPSF